MKYITKIDNEHIVELNGRNIRVTDRIEGNYFVQLGQSAYSGIYVTKGSHEMKSSGELFLDQYVVALEVVRLIEEHLHE